jgi:hypothetical protein
VTARALSREPHVVRTRRPHSLAPSALDRVQHPGAGFCTRAAHRGGRTCPLANGRSSWPDWTCRRPGSPPPGPTAAGSACTASLKGWEWAIERGYIILAAQPIVAEFLATFKDFPPRQKAASFTIDQALRWTSSHPPHKPANPAEHHRGWDACTYFEAVDCGEADMAETLIIDGESYKKRSPTGIWLLTVVTLTVYWSVWYYKINDEARRYLRDESIKPWPSVLAIVPGFVLLFIPVIVSGYQDRPTYSSHGGTGRHRQEG